MPLHTVVAATSDNTVGSTNAAWATARAGSGLSLGTVSATTLNNQYVLSGSYTLDQQFIAFDTSAVSGTILAATLQVVIQGTGGSAFNGYAYAYDWGAAVDTTDWRAGATLAGMTKLATGAYGAVSSITWFTENGTAFRSAIVGGGTTKILLVPAGIVDDIAPVAANTRTLHSADNGTVTNRPTLFIAASTAGEPAIAQMSAEKVAATSADITFTFATDGPTPVAGSLFVAHISCNGETTNPAISGPGTWTKQQESLGTGGGNRPGTAVFYRVMDGTETTAAFTATPDSGTLPMTGTIYRIAGHDPVTPINTSSTTAPDTALQTTYVLNGLTTTRPNCLGLFLVAGTASSVRTFTEPGDLTEDYQFGHDIINAVAQIGTSSALAAAGATGTKTFTPSASAFHAGVAIAIQPPATARANRRMLREVG